MTDPLLPTGDGHTELTDEDRDGLIPTYISTRGELYEAEQRNIASHVDHQQRQGTGRLHLCEWAAAAIADLIEPTHRMQSGHRLLAVGSESPNC